MTSPAPTSAREALVRARSESLGHLLFEAARLLDARALERVNAAADPSTGLRIRPAHTRLFAHIPLEGGVRLTALAEAVGVTKQAVQPLVAELAAWGAVEVVPDPTDGRARLVRWTPLGLQGHHHRLDVLAGLERELAARLGAARVAALREDLAVIVDLLAGP